MATVVLFNDPAVPEQDKIRDALADHYRLVDAPDWGALAEVLKGQTHCVVIFTAPADKINVQVAQIKAIQSTAACVAVIPQEEAQKIKGHQFDADFLLTPLTRFDVISRIATAARITELLASVEESAQLDEVTQLYNRRYFLNRVNEEISLCRRHQSPLSVMVLSVNFFQMYLDSYGYDFVNDLLRHLAVIIRDHKRTEDIVARIGDDEIGLLLPRSTEKGAMPLASRIIETIQTQPFKCDGAEEEISVHAGIAGYPLPEADDECDADALLRYARHALHNARCSLDKTFQLFNDIKPAI